IRAAESFDQFDLPRDVIRNTLSAARFVSPSGITVRHETSTALAAVIDRVAFDRSLARRAYGEGAENRIGARVSELRAEPTCVRATVGGALLRARLAILACGAH